MPEAMDLLPPNRPRPVADSPARETNILGPVLSGADSARDTGRLPVRPGMASQATALARSAPGMRARNLLALQRQFGNGYVQRLVTVAQREPEALRRRGNVQRCACGGIVVGGGQCAACRAKAQAETPRVVEFAPAAIDRAEQIEGGVPNYLRAAMAGGRPDAARFQRAIGEFREQHPTATIDRYATGLGEANGPGVTRQATPGSYLQRGWWFGGSDNVRSFCFQDTFSPILYTSQGTNWQDAYNNLPASVKIRRPSQCHEGACRSQDDLEECGGGGSSQADTGGSDAAVASNDMSQAGQWQGGGGDTGGGGAWEDAGGGGAPEGGGGSEYAGVGSSTEGSPFEEWES